MVGFSKEVPDEKMDNSIFPKKGQVGYVEKTYITENDEGKRIAKVKIREERSPNIGDKFSSRCGQKGTIGILRRGVACICHCLPHHPHPVHRWR